MGPGAGRVVPVPRDAAIRADVTHRGAQAPVWNAYERRKGGKDCRRAGGTACGIARCQVVKLTRCDLDEVDFGEWTRKTSGEVQTLPEWRPVNEARGAAPGPDGETAADVQRESVRRIGVRYHGDHAGTVLRTAIRRPRRYRAIACRRPRSRLRPGGSRARRPGDPAATVNEGG